MLVFPTLLSLTTLTYIHHSLALGLGGVGGVIGIYNAVQSVITMPFQVDGNVTTESDFWIKASDLGDKLQSYTVQKLDDVSSQYKIIDKITDVKEAISTLVQGIRDLMPVIEKKATSIDFEKAREELESRLSMIPELLKEEFPEPSKAPSHDDRVKFFDRVFEIASAEVVIVLGKFGMEKDDAIEKLNVIEPPLKTAVVIIGDIIEQHPVLLEVLVISVTFLTVEVILMRPLLSLFGFSPIGPVRGSLAAWAQSRLFGAYVPAGSWFSYLQRAAMSVSWNFIGILKAFFEFLKHLFGF